MAKTTNNKRKDSKGRMLYTGESERPNGTYMYRYTDNKNKRQTVYAEDLNSLRLKEKQIQRDLDDNIETNVNMTLNQLIDLYLQTKINLAIGTRNNYIHLWERHVKKSTIGNRNILSIKKSTILKFYIELKNKGYSDGILHLIQSFMYPAFELAIEDDLIRKNPCKNCVKEVKTGDAKEKIALTKAQQEIFLNYVKQDSFYKKYYPMFYIMIKTALRVGETIGLTYSDIDLKNKQIKIDHQLIYKKVGDRVKFYATTPKSKKSIRTLCLTPEVEEQLKAQEKYLNDAMIDRTYEVDGYKDFVFLNKRGKPIQPNMLQRALGKIVENYNKQESTAAENEKREPQLLPHISPHTLRHTGCTRMSESGMSETTLQYVMGHSTPAITKIYDHVDIERVKEEMLKVAR